MMGLGLTSCDNEEFLNVTAYDVVDEAASYESKDNAKRALNGVYDLVYPDDAYDGDWGFKPNLFTGCHPTIDTQATGWDKDWNVQAWNSNSSVASSTIGSPPLSAVCPCWPLARMVPTPH